MAIYRCSKWWLSAILELFYHHTRPRTKSVAGTCWPQLPVKFHVNVIHRSIWIFFAYLAWNAYSGLQNGGFGGLSTSKCDYLSSRLPNRPSLHKSTSFKLSTVKIRSRGLTCRRVGRKCDGHTLYTHENLYSVHAQHWTDNKHCEVLITNIN